MTDHAQRIREDLKHIFEIRKVCLNDKRFRINKFLVEIVDKISKELEDASQDLCECGHKKKDHTSSYWEANGTACTQANCWNKCKKFIQKDLCEEGGEDGNKN